MSNLRQLLREKVRSSKPFLTVSIFGVGRCLVEDSIYPLRVNLNPPTMKFCIEHKMVTSFLTRFMDDVEEETKEFKKNQASQGTAKAAEQIKDKVENRTVADNLIAAAELIEIGRDAFRQLAESCYRESKPEDVTKIRFIELKNPDEPDAELDALEEAEPEVLFFPLSFVEESQFLELAMEMLGTITSGADINANIPIVHEVISVDEVTGNIEKKETAGTVEASKSSGVPTGIRSLAPETKQEDKA